MTLRLILAALLLCLLGCQEEPEATVPRGTESTQARDTQLEGILNPVPQLVQDTDRNWRWSDRETSLTWYVAGYD